MDSQTIAVKRRPVVLSGGAIARAFAARWPTRIVQLVLVVLFVAIGIADFVVGFHDANVSLSPGYRLFGVVLLFVAVLSLAAGYGYIRRARWTLVFAIGAATISILIAGYLLLALLREADYTNGLLALLREADYTNGLFFVAVPLCIPAPLLVFDCRRPDRLQKAWALVSGRMGAAVAVVGVLAAVGQVWYTTQFLPVAVPAALKIEPELTKVGTAPLISGEGKTTLDRVVLEATVRVTNLDFSRGYA